VFLKGLAVLGFAGIANAQTVRISGTVVDERQLPIAGATVRLTGDRSTMTAANGRFDFGDAIPGRYLITVTSVGFNLKSVDLNVSRDTVLTIALSHRPVTLDTMVVRPKNLRIKATAVDSATGDFLLQAQATVYPSGKFFGAVSGVFVFDSVAPGPTTIVFEALEHLPKRVELDLTRDTTFSIRLGVDSIALRMIAVQVGRITKRSEAIPMPTTALNRDAIQREHAMTMGDVLMRRSYGAIDTAACMYVDDMRVDRAQVNLLLPELIERMELFRRGGAEVPKFGSRRGERNFGKVLMVRVYTRRYVAALPRQQNLPKVVYMQNGTRPICS